MKYKIVTNGVSIETDFPSFAENIEIGSEIYEISDKEVFIGIITEEFVISTTMAFRENIYKKINRLNSMRQKLSSKTNPYVPIKYPELSPDYYGSINTYKQAHRFAKLINIRGPYIDLLTPEIFLINFLKSRCVTLNDYLEELLLIWRKNVDEFIRLNKEAVKTNHNKFLIEFDVYKKYKTSFKNSFISLVVGTPIGLLVMCSWMFPLLLIFSNEKTTLCGMLIIASILSPFFWFYIGALFHGILMVKFIGKEPIKPYSRLCECSQCSEGQEWLRHN